MMKPTYFRAPINGTLRWFFLLAIAACTCHGTIDLGKSGSASPATSTNLSFIYNGIDTLYSRHVTADLGLVDYEACRAEPLLQRVVDTVEAFDMSSLTSAQDSLAFMINAYNILVIYHLPYTTNKIPGSFFDRPIAIAGKNMSLNDLEKNDPAYIVKFNEPRTHFVLFCGALSCPPLYDSAYRAFALYELMDRRTVSFINNERFNTIPANGDNAKVSQLFEWYEDDFSSTVRDTTAPALLSDTAQGGVKDFIASYLNDSGEKATIRNAPLSFITYDWSVNRQ